MILIVGMPRARTSLLMQTAKHLGISVNGEFTPLEDNLRGNGECRWTMDGVNTADFPSNMAMKVMLDAFLFRSKVSPQNRILFCLRPPEALIWSRIGTGNSQFPEARMRWNYWRLTKQFLLWKAESQNPVLMVPTDYMIADPSHWVGRIAEFLGVPVTQVAVGNVARELTSVRPVEATIDDDAQAVYQEALCIATT